MVNQVKSKEDMAKQIAMERRQKEQEFAKTHVEELLAKPGRVAWVPRSVSRNWHGNSTLGTKDYDDKLLRDIHAGDVMLNRDEEKIVAGMFPNGGSNVTNPDGSVTIVLRG